MRGDVLQEGPHVRPDAARAETAIPFRSQRPSKRPQARSLRDPSGRGGFIASKLKGREALENQGAEVVGMISRLEQQRDHRRREHRPLRGDQDLHRVTRQSVVGSSHIVEDAYRQRICRNEYRKRPIIRAAPPADGAQNLLLQRSEALPAVAGNRNTRIGGRIEYAADHVVSEVCDLRPRTATVFALEVELCRSERFNKFVEAPRIGALEVIYSLLRIAQGDQLPIQLGRRVLLVGDHRQLLPMTERAVLKGLRAEMPETPRDEFERSDFERAYLSRYGRDNGRTLTEQYRMVPEICDLVSKVFYEPHGVKLRTSDDRESDPAFARAFSAPLATPVTWIDTSDEPDHEEKPAVWDETTFSNEAEVEAVMRLLEAVAADTALVEALSAGKSEAPIGIICMYSAQKTRIEEVFSRRPWDVSFRSMVRIDTVDSYQGKENTIVIVSLVRCNGRGDQGHVRIPNRCNVALSRAKERLFIVGARAMWGGVQKRWPMRKVLDEIDAGPATLAVLKVGEIR
jgi:AAA domain-containing protein